MEPSEHRLRAEPAALYTHICYLLRDVTSRKRQPRDTERKLGMGDGKDGKLSFKIKAKTRRIPNKLTENFKHGLATIHLDVLQLRLVQI